MRPLFRSPQTRLVLFLLLLLGFWTVVSVIGSARLIDRWEPDLDIGDLDQLQALRDRYQWALARALWLPLDVVALVLVWLFHVRLERKPIAALGLHGSPGPGLLRGAGLGIGLSALVGVPLMMLLAEPAELVGVASPPGLLASIGLFALASLAMELVMRGYVFTNLLGEGHVVRAVLGSALIYSLFQDVSPDERWMISFLNMVLMGMLLALLRLAAGTLWATIGFQMGWNITLGPVLGLPVSGLPFLGVFGTHALGDGDWGDLGGGAFGPEGGMLCTAVLALASLVLARTIAPRWDATPGEPAP